jgi:GntR family transcriptional regulator, transcriptional repressor for pyruvate dehydrogenase complex
MSGWPDFDPSAYDATVVARDGQPDPFTPVRTRRTFEEVLDQIVDRIRAGQLQEGDYLPSERALSAAMNVSRPTVRQALTSLERAGVIEVRPGPREGARVMTIWVPEELIRQEVRLRTDDIFELLEARRTLEPRLAQLASLRGTDADFAAMESSIAIMEDNAEDRLKVMQTDFAFHRAMWRAAGNTTLENLMRILFRRLEVATDMILRTENDLSRAIELHTSTLAALKRGNATEIEVVMDEHLGWLEEFCETVLDRPRIREVPDFLLSRRAASG